MSNQNHKFSATFLSKTTYVIAVPVSAAVILLAAANTRPAQRDRLRIPQAMATTTQDSLNSSLRYDFSGTAAIQESGSMWTSSDAVWWINSGAYLYNRDGIGATNIGDLGTWSKWYTLYKQNNPIDTDYGLHPQNIFRAVTKPEWRDFTQEIYFQIVKDQRSTSPNRNESNGLLLLNHYLDSNNLYYAGIRVDGKAIIKKKQNGIYYTMASKKIFGGTYDRTLTPNLMPKNSWIGVRTQVQTLPDNTVTVALYMDNGKTGTWQKILEARDDGTTFGGPAITGSGHAGLRTDFMDVKFTEYQVLSLSQ